MSSQLLAARAQGNAALHWFKGLQPPVLALTLPGVQFLLLLTFFESTDNHQAPFLALIPSLTPLPCSGLCSDAPLPAALLLRPIRREWELRQPQAATSTAAHAAEQGDTLHHGHLDSVADPRHHAAAPGPVTDVASPATGASSGAATAAAARCSQVQHERPGLQEHQPVMVPKHNVAGSRGQAQLKQAGQQAQLPSVTSLPQQQAAQPWHSGALLAAMEHEALRHLQGRTPGNSGGAAAAAAAARATVTAGVAAEEEEEGAVRPWAWPMARAGLVKDAVPGAVMLTDAAQVALALARMGFYGDHHQSCMPARAAAAAAGAGRGGAAPAAAVAAAGSVKARLFALQRIARRRKDMVSEPRPAVASGAAGAPQEALSKRQRASLLAQ